MKESKLKVEPVKASPVGVYVVRADLGRRVHHDIARAMKKAGIDDGIIVPMKPGESISALTFRQALALHKSLGDLLQHRVDRMKAEAAEKAAAAPAEGETPAAIETPAEGAGADASL